MAEQPAGSTETEANEAEPSADADLERSPGEHADPSGTESGKEAEPAPVKGDAPAVPNLGDVVIEPLKVDADAPPEPFRLPRRVVGIGGSAGAFEAAGRVLGGLDPGVDLAIVIVQHLDPGHRSQLASLLARQTALNVVEAEHGQRLESDTVYVIPPGRSLTIEGGCIHLMPRGAELGHQWIIDAFLTSLALDVGPASIGLLLSGTLSDGAEGLAAIHRAGGATLVQSRSTSKFPDMPAVALKLGVVDREVDVEELADAILELSEDDVPFRRPAEATAMDRIRQAVKLQTSMDLRDYRLPTVTRRLQRRMDAVKVRTLAEYAEIIESDTAEAQNLHNDMLIAVTRFFRDAEVFSAIRGSVIPEIVSRKKDGEVIRVWVPGCSTGQEAYSLAMLFDDAISEAGKNLELQVFGTDRSGPAIQAARTGAYDLDVKAEMPKHMYERYMSEEKGLVRVRKQLRSRCIFAEHDLLHDPPFSQVDLVSCRNVLIYMDGPAQSRIMDALHFGLVPSGWLVLGGSESGLRSDARFAQIGGRQPLYKRAGGQPRLPPVIKRPESNPKRVVTKALVPAVVEATPALATGSFTEAPRAVIVDERFDILFDSPGLHLPGEHNILRVLDKPLADAVRRAVVDTLEDHKLHRGQAQGDKGTIHILAFPLQAGRVLLLLTAHRLPSPHLGARRLVKELLRHMDVMNQNVGRIIGGYQGTLEELSCAHEEAMSANEELQSGNEELLTANEEAQSAAEELRTLNDEMSRRQHEAEAALDDIEALMESEMMPVLIMAQDGQLLRVNSDARAMFGLAQGEALPRIQDVEVPFRNLDLVKIAAGVISGSARRELDALHEDGGAFEVRVTRAAGRIGPRDAVIVRIQNH